MHPSNRRHAAPALLKPALACAALALSWHLQAADFNVTGPDGRRIQLKDDGTWKYEAATGKDAPPAKPEPAVQAALRFEQKVDRGNHCRLVFSLTNNLPYEIQHIVPYFSVYRANGVVHETVSIAYQSIRPMDKIERAGDFSRIMCSEIARVQVTGGDRCEMGALNKFSEANGQCLTFVRVMPTDQVRFDK